MLRDRLESLGKNTIFSVSLRFPFWRTVPSCPLCLQRLQPQQKGIQLLVHLRTHGTSWHRLQLVVTLWTGYASLLTHANASRMLCSSAWHILWHDTMQCEEARPGMTWLELRHMPRSVKHRWISRHKTLCDTWLVRLLLLLWNRFETLKLLKKSFRNSSLLTSALRQKSWQGCHFQNQTTYTHPVRACVLILMQLCMITKWYYYITWMKRTHSTGGECYQCYR